VARIETAAVDCERVFRCTDHLTAMLFDRVILLVLDSVGIGEMPDAARYGDEGSDTLGHVLASRTVRLPNLTALGLGNIRPLPGVAPARDPSAAYGKAAIVSDGKDTTTGHWEMAGIVTTVAFPTYPHGFPPRVIEVFERAIGRRVLGNKPASGTEIIAELGEEHMRTGRPIVYTSADSVFQIAAHEEVIAPDELYRMCEVARRLLTGDDEVGRVIARPFVGEPGRFVRTYGRRDYAIEPPATTLLDALKERGLAVVAVGKVGSIFCHRGTTDERTGKGNLDLVDRTLEAMRDAGRGLVFSNLVDFDMLYGHRNDVEGYARALEEFDARIPELGAALGPRDLCIVTADHGCDPTTPSTDHTREYVPILAFGPAIAGGRSLGTRETMADIGQTIADVFGLRLAAGTSFLADLT
jgi:phosphopentomutase